MNSETGLGSHSWTGYLAAELFSTVGFLNTVFVTLFRASVERASCGVHRLLGTAWSPTPQRLLWLHWSVFAVCAGRSAWGELVIGQSLRARESCEQ